MFLAMTSHTKNLDVHRFVVEWISIPVMSVNPLLIACRATSLALVGLRIQILRFVVAVNRNCRRFGPRYTEAGSAAKFALQRNRLQTNETLTHLLLAFLFLGLLGPILELVDCSDNTEIENRRQTHQP